MKLYLISDNIDTLTGMRLAGIEGVVVHEEQELRDALNHALSDRDIGIILLTEKFGRDFPDIISSVRRERRMPLRRPDFITAHVNEVIGLKL